jgi:hypothetical protein
MSLPEGVDGDARQNWITSGIDRARRAFRSWDEADTQEKKQMLKRLIMNAGAIELCDDDLIRSAIDSSYRRARYKIIPREALGSGLTGSICWAFLAVAIDSSVLPVAAYQYQQSHGQDLAPASA